MLDSENLRFRNIMGKAMTHGAVCDGSVFHWKIHGNCESPIDRFIHSPNKVNTVHISVRCRKCDPCKKSKKNYWGHRIVNESKLAKRNWFVTLTLGSKMRSIENAQTQLIGFQKEVTKFLKRVRKTSKAKLRYCCVFEAHKDETPHAHLIIHEIEGTVTVRDIRENWIIGFEQTRLIKGDTADTCWYVAKYIAKSPVHRIRCSLHYGLDHSKQGNEAPRETPDPTLSPK